MLEFVGLDFPFTNVREMYGGFVLDLWAYYLLGPVFLHQLGLN